ncbi:DNA primase small subunit-like [Phlebotomus argentipes]|uniref:DNA primase small subunit-like n=1 Tax=Phlebotomus argentipes TaxID=94469 RepID=UPI0028931EEF|nr:DNA primase small subunit-like [Phlebotomus argentipes]
MKKDVISSKKQQDEYNNYLSMLSLYYEYLYPTGYIQKWLSHNSTDPNVFKRREFALLKRDAKKNKIYTRNVSIKSEEFFRTMLLNELPFTIEIGAVMNKRPLSAKLSKNYCPVEKELIFDIDASDFDDVRTCCIGKQICRKCWKLIVVACKILKMVLTEDFGFQDMLWVFSGRRGIHCWVCDKNARSLTKEVRESILDYLYLPFRLFKRNDDLLVKWNHPLIQRTLKIVEEVFEEICLEDQNLFSSWKNVEKFLVAEVPGEQNRGNLREVLGNVMDCGSVVIWSAFCAVLDSLEQPRNEQMDLVGCIKLYLLYPRLDLNVTKGLSHLVKTPFCVHPETMKVAIPFNPDKVESFDIETVPTLPALCQEIQRCLAKNVSVTKMSLLNHSLSLFRDFVTKLKP